VIVEAGKRESEDIQLLGLKGQKVNRIENDWAESEQKVYDLPPSRQLVLEQQVETVGPLTHILLPVW